MEVNIQVKFESLVGKELLDGQNNRKLKGKKLENRLWEPNNNQVMRDEVRPLMKSTRKILTKARATRDLFQFMELAPSLLFIHNLFNIFSILI